MPSYYYLYRNYSSTDSTFVSMTPNASLPNPTSGSLGWEGPTGKQFKEWNTAANGSGQSYSVGTPATANLYAIWENSTPYTLYRNYDNNDIVSIDQYLELSNPIELEWDSPSGKSFKEWNEARDGTGFVHAIGSIPRPGLSLYAIWRELVYYTASNEEFDLIADAIKSKAGIASTLQYPSGFVSAIEAIETGTDTSDATATASDILSGKTAYVNGTKITGNIPSRGAQTITPGTTNKTISSGRYLTGTQTIKGDANLIAANIAQGVSIFGVTGTHSGGGGGGTDVEDAIIKRTISGTYENSRVITIGNNAFASCSNLTSVSFPVCTTIGSNAFASCSNLTSVSFPVCTTIGSNAFGYCTSLTTVSFPSCTSIGSSAFNHCSNLTSVSFPVCKTIGNYAFSYCTSLTTVSFPSCTTIGTYAFYNRSLTSVSFPVCKTISDYAFGNCTSLTTVSFPSCTTIGSNAFSRCYKLISLYLTSSSFVSLAASNAFASTPIGGYSTSAGRYGSIYVPASMLASYQTRTNWTYFSSRMVGV